jgi:Ran GTPase-activating protein (RanGAP) involved in mRNA processing and transport
MEVLNLTGNHISVLGSEALGIMLQQHPVRELCLSNNAIGDTGFELLSVGLSNVKKLQVNGIQLSDAGLAKCAHTLKHCSVIGIADNHCGAKGITSLVSSSRHASPCFGAATQPTATTSISSLVLSRNQISDAGCVSLGRQLDILTISHLDLSHCGIGDDGAALIAKGVEHSSHIEFLSMHSNSIGDTGCTALADALTENKTLKVLKLWRNNIGDAGAACIGRALGANHVLKSLQLSFNRISTQGAVGLSTGLRKNNTLEEMNLEFNKIGAAGANSLLSAMQHNRTMVDLKLYPEYHVSKRMKQLLNGNKKSQQLWDESLEVCNAIYV